MPTGEIQDALSSVLCPGCEEDREAQRRIPGRQPDLRAGRMGVVGRELRADKSSPSLYEIGRELKMVEMLGPPQADYGCPVFI